MTGDETAKKCFYLHVLILIKKNCNHAYFIDNPHMMNYINIKVVKRGCLFGCNAKFLIGSDMKGYLMQ